MGSWWLSDLWQTNQAIAVGWVFWVIASITLHELGHGWAALRCGDDTPRLTGHMTPNPFVHIPPMAWVLFALTGITWGLMPVNPSRFRRSWHDGWVSFAGPLVNLLLIVVLTVLGALWIVLAQGRVADNFYDNMRIFFRVGVGLNAILFLFNLLPVPPLDGSRILAAFVPPYRRFLGTQGGIVAGMVLFVLVFMTFGRYVGAFALGAGLLAMDLLAALLKAVLPA